MVSKTHTFKHLHVASWAFIYYTINYDNIINIHVVNNDVHTHIHKKKKKKNPTTNNINNNKNNNNYYLLL